MIPLYVIDIARQHAAAHSGHRGGSPLRRLALAAAVVVASCTVVATVAASLLR